MQTQINPTKTRLEIQFDGANYHGWQFQTNAVSIQELINKALVKIYKTKVTTMGSGRTDAGVHALKYYVFFKAPFFIEANALVRGLNTHLPADIRVLAARELTEDVHATIDAKKREYRYFFTNQAIPTAFQAKYIANISYTLDFNAMKQACQMFVGEYDFANFQTLGSDVRTTTREIFECELLEHTTNHHPLLPDHYYIRIVGQGFLKQMVRLMVGAIWDVGRAKITLGEIEQALQDPTLGHIAPVAPACGLYKYDITY